MATDSFRSNTSSFLQQFLSSSFVNRQAFHLNGKSDGGGATQSVAQQIPIWLQRASTQGQSTARFQINCRVAMTTGEKPAAPCRAHEHSSYVKAGCHSTLVVEPSFTATVWEEEHTRVSK